jgi:hypothetical protein
MRDGHPTPAQDRVIASIEVAEDDGLMRRLAFPSKDEFSIGGNYKGAIWKLLGKKRPWRQREEYQRFHLDRIWNGSADWRRSIADQVDKVDDLSRRALAKHLAVALGHDVGDNINTSKAMTERAASEEDKIIIEALFRWFAQTYALTLSEAVGISANFPVYDFDEDFALDSITAPHARSPNADPDISIDVELPPLSVLMSIPPRDLLAIRDELGREYFTAMARWNLSSGAERQAAQARVASTLRHYAARICERSDERLPMWVSVSAGPMQQRAENLLGYSKMANGLFPDPLLGLANSVGSVVLGVTRVLTKERLPRVGDRSLMRLEIDTKRHLPSSTPATS